jgi:hypothetical protein
VKIKISYDNKIEITCIINGYKLILEKIVFFEKSRMRQIPPPWGSILMAFHLDSILFLVWTWMRNMFLYRWCGSQSCVLYMKKKTTSEGDKRWFKDKNYLYTPCTHRVCISYNQAKECILYKSLLGYLWDSSNAECSLKIIYKNT